MFQRYQQSEQLLVLARIEMIISGVSTRKIERITEALCGNFFSKSTILKLCEHLVPFVKDFRNCPLQKHHPFVIVDALYLKVCEEHRVRLEDLRIATAVNEDGYCKVIGFQMANAEFESSWSEFFSLLKQRGLQNVDPIVSDNHKDLVKAIKKTFSEYNVAKMPNALFKKRLRQSP